MEIRRFHRLLEYTHVNALPPRAYFIPYAAGDDPRLPRETSSRFISLNGEWDFKCFQDVERLEFEDPGFTERLNLDETMPVPFCWQLRTDRGYDPPQYINQDYPYQVDPPHLPDAIPCGVYRRRFPVEKNTARVYTVTFEGVASCFYLWINGSFIGYSEVSHCTTEFEITEALRNGENEIAVLAVKLCTGSYLEDQDFFRLSGIFRDVYLLERDTAHIADVQTRVTLNDAFTEGSLKLRFTKPAALNVSCALFAPDGSLVSETAATGDTAFSVPAPVLWNPEEPALYELRIAAGAERIRLAVGFRRIEIKNKTLLFNGKKIKLRGVNRHDMDPETGYAVSADGMRKDLYLMKRGNVNAIRTSHYPNDPRFPELCDELGFWVINEADLESHGMGYNYGDWYWDYWAYLCDAPEWREKCVDRAARLYERDKNHPCVIFWSLGNESGCGENHRAMARYIRERDPAALIHYENAHLEYAARLGKDFSDISDVESRMYASLDYLRAYLEDPARTKPFFYCEYVSAWSTGDIPLHWNEFERYDGYCGGCVWEFADHAVNIGTKERPQYRYGGDFGDYPNDGISCLDGLVFPDRTPRPGWNDMKDCYKPFSAAYKNGALAVTNKRFFAGLDDCALQWTLEANGKPVAFGTIEPLDIPAGETRVYPLALPACNGGTVTMNAAMTSANDAPWAEAGHILGETQFILQNEAFSLPAARRAPLQTAESRTEIRVRNQEFSVVFDKNTGMLRQITAGEALLTAPAVFTVFRNWSPACGSAAEWAHARFDHAYSQNYGTRIVLQTPEETVIETTLAIAAPALPPALRARVRYTVRADAAVTIRAEVTVTENAPPLPRFGLELLMPKQFANAEYFGYGPAESYPDRFCSQRLSLWKTTAADNFVHYIRPTENGAHYGTKYAAVTDESGAGLAVSDPTGKGFLFNVSPYTDRDLLETAHDDELPLRDFVTVHIDHKMHADNAGQADREPWRAFTEKAFTFEVELRPI